MGNAEGFLKEVSRDSGYRKAAEFLIILGKEQAAEILKHLSDDEVEGITKELVKIDRVEPRQAQRILEEFGYLVKSQNLVARGGLDKARAILIAAFGEEKGERVFSRIAKKRFSRPFSFLSEVEDDQILLLLKEESPPVLAVILSHLEPDKAARLLSSLSLAEQKEVARRIARMKKLTPEVLSMAEESLRKKLQTQGNIVIEKVDGQSALLEIISHLDPTSEKLIVDELSETDPELAHSLKGRLYDIDVVSRVRDRDLQEILQEFSEPELALVLKGKSGEIKERILSNVSTRRREMIQSEYDALGRVLKTDVEKATKDFTEYIRDKAESKKILILNRDDEFVE
jgi:flagellar motor switch protein FliG